MSVNKNNGNKAKKNGDVEQVQESLFKFPCEFPFKIMAENKSEIESFVRETLEKEVGKKDIIDISVRQSREANYISITAIITARDKAQLDKLYEIFSTHKSVKMVL